MGPASSIRQSGSGYHQAHDRGAPEPRQSPSAPVHTRRDPREKPLARSISGYYTVQPVRGTLSYPVPSSCGRASSDHANSIHSVDAYVAEGGQPSDAGYADGRRPLATTCPIRGSADLAAGGLSHLRLSMLPSRSLPVPSLRFRVRDCRRARSPGRQPHVAEANCQAFFGRVILLSRRVSDGRNPTLCQRG